LNLSSTATLGTEKPGPFREGDVVERERERERERSVNKSQCMDCPWGGGGGLRI